MRSSAWRVVIAFAVVTSPPEIQDVASHADEVQAIQ
jgi:hypothetical protein